MRYHTKLVSESQADPSTPLGAAFPIPIETSFLADWCVEGKGCKAPGYLINIPMA